MTIPQWHIEERADGSASLKDNEGRLVAHCPRINIAGYIACLHNSGGDRNKAVDLVMGSLNGKLLVGV